MEIPDFETAANRFREFLRSNGHPTDLLWVFREDLSSYNHRILVKVPVPKANEGLTEARYAAGRAGGIAVSMEMFCLLKSTPCCYVWVPKDSSDALHRMAAGLKLCIPTTPIHARPMHNCVLWYLQKWLDRRKGRTHQSDSVPSRHEPLDSAALIAVTKPGHEI